MRIQNLYELIETLWNVNFEDLQDVRKEIMN